MDINYIWWGTLIVVGLIAAVAHFIRASNNLKGEYKKYELGTRRPLKKLDKIESKIKDKQDD